MAIFCKSSLILSLFLVSASNGFNLTILHTNDVHSRFDEAGADGFEKCTAKLKSEQGCYGGVARRVTAVKDVRAQEENVVLLDAGDEFQGTLWFTVYRGNQTALFMNEMAYDAMVSGTILLLLKHAIGTHEFDASIEGLVEFLEDVTFPGLACNIDASQEPSLQPLIACSTILSINNERLGIVGYTHPANANYSRTGNLSIGPILSSVQEEVDRLTREERLNKIIALGHAGIDIDQEIARTVTGVDVVVGGRSQTFLYTGNPPASETPRGEYPTVVIPDSDPNGKVLVVQSYKYGKYLGKLHVVFDENGVVTSYGGNPILLDDTIKEDTDILKMVNQNRGPVDELASTEVGYSLVYLNGSLDQCGVGECNMGIHFAEAMLAYQLTNVTLPDWSSVSFAMVNADSFRVSIPQGPITFQDVMDVFPYGDTIDVIEMKGDDILNALEYSVDDLASTLSPQREFLQTAGIRIVYDLTAEPGKRVVSARVLCTSCATPRYEPIDTNAVYKLVTNNYISTGGTGYDIVRDTLISRVKGADDIEVWADYFKKNSPVWTALEERVTFQPRTNNTSVDDCNAGESHHHLNKTTNILVISFGLIWLSIF
ncbi:5'-nucleotidase [Holothuria leucospilota]|uniref:5'-nucleotidase n=1 Tax=Holothuria leucospilota TaxID=206669 RepID=A0A9Q1C9T8_HOLLE|nr:5'-nucleotidase [Holothuria leucospilota]